MAASFAVLFLHNVGVGGFFTLGNILAVSAVQKSQRE